MAPGEGAPATRRRPRAAWRELARVALLTASLGPLGLPGLADAEHHEKSTATTVTMPVAQRQEIFRALAQARARADVDAAKASVANPESEAQAELANKLAKEYRGKVVEKFGITERRAEQIVKEGYANAWKTRAPAPEGVKTSLP